MKLADLCGTERSNDTRDSISKKRWSKHFGSLSLDENPDRPMQLFFYIWRERREMWESTSRKRKSVMERGQALID